MPRVPSASKVCQQLAMRPGLWLISMLPPSGPYPPPGSDKRVPFPLQMSKGLSASPAAGIQVCPGNTTGNFQVGNGIFRSWSSVPGRSGPNAGRACGVHGASVTGPTTWEMGMPRSLTSSVVPAEPRFMPYTSSFLKNILVHDISEGPGDLISRRGFLPGKSSDDSGHEAGQDVDQI